MTVIATCDQCNDTCVCSTGVTGQPVMPDHDNPKTGQHCPWSGHIALTGVS